MGRTWCSVNQVRVSTFQGAARLPGRSASSRTGKAHDGSVYSRNEGRPTEFDWETGWAVSQHRRPHDIAGVALVAPVVLYLLLIQAYPFASALFTSLTDKRIGTEGNFVGLANYVDLLQDSLFQGRSATRWFSPASPLPPSLSSGSSWPWC